MDLNKSNQAHQRFVVINEIFCSARYSYLDMSWEDIIEMAKDDIIENLKLTMGSPRNP